MQDHPIRSWLPGQQLVSMDTYMTRDSCENDKVFINFNYFQNKRALSFTTRNCQQARKRIRTDNELLSSEAATDFNARRIAVASALKIELIDGNRKEQTCSPKTAADTTLSPFLGP